MRVKGLAQGHHTIAATRSCRLVDYRRRLAHFVGVGPGMDFDERQIMGGITCNYCAFIGLTVGHHNADVSRFYMLLRYTLRYMIVGNDKAVIDFLSHRYSSAAPNSIDPGRLLATTISGTLNLEITDPGPQM